MSISSERTRAYGYLALAMATVGSIVPATKVIAGALPPFLAGALRLAVAAVILIPWAASRRREARVGRQDRHDKALLALQAAAGTVGFTVLMILGTARTSAVDASLVAGSLPLVAGLVSMLLLGERPGRRLLLGIALAAGGLTLVNLPALASGGGPRPDRLLGNGLVLGAIVSESLFILLNKRLHQPLPPLTQSATMTCLGLFYLLPLALMEGRGFHFEAVSASVWVAVAYYGLVPTVLGFVWWYKGAERVSGAEAGVLTAVMPVSGASLSALVLGEAFGVHHVVGLSLVVAAIVLAARSPEPKGAAVAAPRPAAGGEAPAPSGLLKPDTALERRR